jgi:hypothetical protein
MAQVVEYLPCKCEALISNPSPTPPKNDQITKQDRIIPFKETKYELESSMEL